MQRRSLCFYSFCHRGRMGWVLLPLSFRQPMVSIAESFSSQSQWRQPVPCPSQWVQELSGNNYNMEELVKKYFLLKDRQRTVDQTASVIFSFQRNERWLDSGPHNTDLTNTLTRRPETPQSAGVWESVGQLRCTGWWRILACARICEIAIHPLLHHTIHLHLSSGHIYSNLCSLRSAEVMPSLRLSVDGSQHHISSMAHRQVEE